MNASRSSRRSGSRLTAGGKTRNGQKSGRSLTYNHRKRRGLVLILVLIVVTMLTLSSYAYVELMRSQREAVVLSCRQLQTKLIVDSGLEYTRSFLSQPDATQTESGGRYNNLTIFQHLVVVPNQDPLHRGCFTVLAPALDDEANLAGVRYGLEDESCRLNLNTLLSIEKQQQGIARTLLLALPQMTNETADAILDWLDADNEPREFGAEDEYYSTLEPPYMVKNGPLDTVEELLRVRGVTPAMLFGSDVNRNGQLDPAEKVPEEIEQLNATTSNETTIATGSLDRGWSAYLTLVSRERNWNPDGMPRIFLNQPDLTKLHEELSAVFPPEWANFIVAYRQGTPGASGGGSSGNAQRATRQLDFNKPARTNITQVLDLIGSTTQVTFAGDTRAVTVQSPFESGLIAMGVYLPGLLDQVTVNPADTIPGRLNILQSPAALLRGIPGLTDEIIEQILELRTAEIDQEKQPNRRHETWLLTEGVVTLEQMRLLLPFVNSGGHVFRAQIVGYFQHGEAAARAEVIFDATGLVPRVLLWRDMSHLGRGYALETLGLEYSE